MTAAASWTPGGKVAAAPARRDSPGSAQLVLVIQARAEMVAHRPGVPVAEPVVQPLVVSVIEPLLLQGPFEVPVDFGHEAEVGGLLPHAPGRLRPEGLRRDAPGPLEDLGQDQHRHVAAHPVALPGNPQQLVEHRVLGGRVAVVELERIRPAGEVRVAPVGEQPIAAAPLDPGIVVRGTGQVEFRADDIILRVVLDPGVIGRRVVGDEVEHQLQAAVAEAVAKPCECLVASKGRMRRIA